MRHAMQKYLTILLCAVLLLGVFCPAAAAGKPAEPTASEESAGIASDPEKTIYGVPDETTFVPAGYTFVYTGPNGETYTQVAEGDMFISPRILTTEEATALAALEYGNPKSLVADDGSVLQQMEINPQEAAQYSQAVEAILNGATVPQGETVNVLYEAYPRDEMVEVLITFDDAPVAKRAGMSVCLGQPLGQAEQSMQRTMETAQLSTMSRISRTLGYEVQTETQMTLQTNAVSATVRYEDLAAIRQMPGVKRAILMPAYSVPEEETVQIQSARDLEPFMKSAGPAMGANGAWDLGYKGEGMSVAIIDTGISLTNPAFQQEPQDQSRVAYTQEEIAGLLAGYRFHAEELVDGLTPDQVYYSSKIPFAFNYADRAADYGECGSDAHGSHVAGIVAGNLPEAGKQSFEMDTMGIAPEAQLVVMKVFDAKGSCYFDYIAAALEDAILLGVDCANLSLGSDAGAYYDEGITEFYEAACDAGINVVIAAGNAYFTGYSSGWGNNMIRSTSVCTGTVASPGTYDPVLTVASAENDMRVSGSSSPSLSYWDKRYNKRIYMKYFEHPDVPEELRIRNQLGGQSFEWTDSLKDAAEKIALIELTGENVDLLVSQAVKAKAVALVVYRMLPDPHSWEAFQNTEFEQTDFSIPVVGVSCQNGIHFFDEDYTPEQIRVEAFWNPSETAGQMSEFSSWGPTDGLTLKPEITGIGGNVFSSWSGNSFVVSSGTSMATPAVAASAALVRQYLKELGVAEEALADTVNRLLMSTAAPIVDEEHGTFYFVRRQGAGLANPAAAMASQAYIQVAGTNKSKFELGEDRDRIGVYTMDFEVVNFSDEEKTYTLDTTVLGQKADGGKIKNGKVTYLVYDYARELDATVTSSATDGSVTVPAHSSTQVHVSVTLSDADKAYMDERFPYGTYVEGFVQLISEDHISLSAPFLAFYGDFGEAPLFNEAYSYSSLLGKYPYSTVDRVVTGIWSFRNTLAHMADDVPSYESDLFFLGDSASWREIISPEDFEERGYRNNETKFLSERCGLSPNGDGDLDDLRFYATLNRNAALLKYTVINKTTGEILATEEYENIAKTHYGLYLGGAEQMLNMDWLYPRIEDDGGWYYDTSRCLLEEDTEIVIRIEATTELETNTKNANDAVEFYFHIDTTGPMDDPDALKLKHKKLGPDLSEYLMTLNINENWYLDDIILFQLWLNPETNQWTGSCMNMAGTAAWRREGTSCGTIWKSFGESDKMVYIARDFAGNTSAISLRGGHYLMDEHVDLQTSATTLAVGDTVTIENIAKNNFQLWLEWASLTPEIGEIIESDTSSCTVKANACGFLKVRCGYSSAAEKVLTFRVVDPSLEGTFTDISNHWAKDDILMATGLGLFRGMTDSTFCPQTSLSRGQLVTVLYRMEGSPEVTGSSGFQDVAPNQYYTQAVAWAKENGLVNGVTDTLFRPADSITREQFAAILYRYASWKEQDVTAQANLASFADAAGISAYAQIPMAWAVAEGLIQGISETTLSPRGTTTRAQAATILVRYLERL